MSKRNQTTGRPQKPPRLPDPGKRVGQADLAYLAEGVQHYRNLAIELEAENELLRLRLMEEITQNERFAGWALPNLPLAALMKPETDSREREFIESGSVVISARVAVRYGLGGNDYKMIKIESVYPLANADDIEAELLPRLRATLWNVPTPENVRGERPEGVSEDTLLLAVQQIAVYLQPGLNNRYWDELDRIFESDIWPECDTERTDKDAARKKFRDYVQATIRDMAKFRDVDDIPQGQRGRKKK